MTQNNTKIQLITLIKIISETLLTTKSQKHTINYQKITNYTD